MMAALVPAPAHAGATQVAGANAQVLEEIQFAVLLDMNFGKVVSNGSAGVLDLDPNAGRACDPTLICTGAFAASQLRLTGSDAFVQVNFSPTFLLTGPGDPMVAEPQFPGGPGAVVQLTGGEAVVRFGAKLYVNANQAPGTYSGDFSVYLEYN
ncbi:MAG TPA: DUF4402 domain-containing protein [Novosphingobium sp.]|nr:DUF4402 domain-containing protein [Novosphingobium sp.]